METNRLQSGGKKINSLYVLAFISISCFFIVFPILVHAQSVGSDRSTRDTFSRDSSVVNLEDLNPLGKGTTIEKVIGRVIEWLVKYIGPSIMTLMILWGAFRIMTAGGEPDKFKEGKNLITYAVVGYALLLMSSGLISILKEVLGAK